MFKFQQVLDSLSKRLKKKENAIMSEKTNELKRSRTCAWWIDYDDDDDDEESYINCLPTCIRIYHYYLHLPNHINFVTMG